MAPEHALDDVRRAAGYRTVAEVAALAPRVAVLDPGSTLVAGAVELGDGVVLYPGVVLSARGSGSITVGAGTVLGPGPVSVVADGGRVSIGAGVVLGPGGVTIVARRGSAVEVADEARLHGGAFVEGPASFGAGAQLLGAVAVRDVVLEGGGDHAAPDPDDRGGVIKGTGRVHGARVGVGEVIGVGAGGRPDTSEHVVDRQRAHHPVDRAI